MRCCLSIYPGVSRIYTPRRSFQLRYPCISVQPPSLLNDILGGRDWASLEMHLEAEIEWSERCTWRPWSIKFGDALGGRGRVNSEMHFEAVIERVWRCNWGPRLSELRDTLRGRDQASLEMHLETKIEWTESCTWGRDRASLEMHLVAEIEWTESCTWRTWSIEFGDALGGCDRASLEMHLQAMIERDWRSTWRRSIWREARWQLTLYSLVNLLLWECRELSTISAERWETGWEWETVDLGMMLYLVYAVLGVNSWLWHGEIERDDLTSCS